MSKRKDKIKRSCEDCSKHHTMDCPNSSYCFDTTERFYWEIDYNLKGVLKMSKRYGFGHMMFDLIMTLLTGGLWLIWVLIRYLRTH